MNELIMALMVIGASFAKVPVPEVPPQVHMVSQEEVQGRACGEKGCPNLHFFTDPKTYIIYVNKDVDYSFTFAKAELLHEITRYILTAHGIYKPTALCSKNVKIEMALDAIEFDYLKMEVHQGTYVGKGLPEPSDIPPHVFFCTPDESLIKEELKV